MYAAPARDVWGDDDAAWIECMIQCGMDEGFQDAVMDPRFRAIRLRETCAF